MTASEKAATNRRGAGSGIRRWLTGIDQQIVGLVIALVVLLVFFGIRIPGQFFNPLNLMSIGEGVTLIGIAALSSTVVLILGGLDVSLGSLVGFCSAAAGVAMMRIDSPLAGSHRSADRRPGHRPGRAGRDLRHPRPRPILQPGQPAVHR